jgi:hypothetical protein
MNAVRSSFLLIALCSLFASSLVRADDCSDALMAESCACMSTVRSEREQPRSVDASARRSKTSKGAGTKVAQRTKNGVASAQEINPAK